MTTEKTLTIPCDDLKVTDAAGDVVIDRAGQHVTYLERPKWGVLKRLSRIVNDQSRVFELDEVLCRAIISWDWVDSTDKLLPPPSPDVLDGLDQEEIAWLVRHVPGLAETPKSN